MLCRNVMSMYKYTSTYINFILYERLFYYGQDPAPSSKSVQGSTSKSLSCCFDFPDAAADLDSETGLLWGVAKLLELNPEFLILCWRETNTIEEFRVHNHNLWLIYPSCLYICAGVKEVPLITFYGSIG
jgi:hypothetical protein